MSKLSKVLSILLAVTLIFSTASIGVEAIKSPYKDSAITRYDSIDKPILEPSQYASMAMDEIDRMLGEANKKIHYELAGLITIDADFTSVDKALDSIGDLVASVKPMLPTIGGDVEQLDFSALYDDNNKPRVKRTTAGKTDTDIFLMLLKFLKDNSAILKKVPRGSKENGGLDLGIIGGFVDLGDKLNIPKMVKEKLAPLVWPDKTTFSDAELSKTVDEYVRLFLDEIFSGNYAKFEKGEPALKEAATLIKQYLPNIANQINPLEDSVYTLVDTGIKISINSVVIPYTTPRVLALLGRLCGYDYIKTKDADGDTIWVRGDSSKDEPNAMTNVINWHEDENGKITGYNLQSLPIDDWGDDWIFDHVNDITGLVAEEVLSIDLDWDYTRGNEALVDNIISVAKAVLAETGDALFASYIKVLTPEEIEAMDDEEFVSYVLRSILNASISDVFIPDSCETVLEVLFELAKTMAADLVPSSDYSDLDPDLDGVIQICLDMAAYGLNSIASMELEYGMDVDDFSTQCMNWLEDRYGGLLKTIVGNTGLEKLNYIFFNLIPANWLSTRDGAERDDLYELIFGDVVDNILNFDLASVLELLNKNEDGELNGTLIEVLLARLTGIINFILPGVFPNREYKTLETLMDTNLLGTIIENLVNTLYTRATDSRSLLNGLIPLICTFLGLSDAESFGYPYVSLEDQHTVGQEDLTSFYMYNGSGGLNTNWTKKDGTRVQDKLYNYYIRSVTTSNPAVTVSPEGGFYINGGESQTFTLNGVSSALNTVLKVTVTYDVYSEKGTVMTQNPLTATTYSYIYDAKNVTPDDEPIKADTPAANLHWVSYEPVLYLAKGAKLGNVLNYSMDLGRTKNVDSSSHQKDATISVDSVTIDPALAALGLSADTEFSAATNKNGGSKEYIPFKVDNAANKDTELDVGIYSNIFQFKATPSHSVDETISFTQKIFVYDDAGLGSLLGSAVNADRQEANYSKDGGFEATWLRFGVKQSDLPEKPEREYDEDGNETPASEAAYEAYLEELEEYYDTAVVNGAQAWNAYVSAVNAATRIMYAPRLISTMSNFNEVDLVTGNNQFKTAAKNLYEATQKLEACSISSGTDSIQAARDAIITPDTYIDPDTEEEVTYDYDDARHTFFGRADYINYTYVNFKSELRAADRILDGAKAAAKKGETYPLEPIRAAYVAHRVALYGERLIRVRAYKTYLAEAIEDYTPLLEAGQNTPEISYSNKTWNEFTRAYNFAVQVNGEEIGATIGNTDKLADDGLRQSKVNDARSHLIKAAKRLTKAVPTVDYTQIQAKIEELTELIETHNDPQVYTKLTWSTFAKAYNAAVDIVEAELEDTPSNQARVDEVYEDLVAAYEGLKTLAPSGSWSFMSDDDLGIGWNPYIRTTDIYEYEYLTGLSAIYPAVADFVETSGSYDFEVIPNKAFSESTGAIFIVYVNGDVLLEVPIVLYGDITGDCVIDGLDYTELINAQNMIGLTDWEEDVFLYEENAYAMAADVDHNGTLDGMDNSLMEQIMNDEFVYNQSYQPDDPYYCELYFYS